LESNEVVAGWPANRWMQPQPFTSRAQTPRDVVQTCLRSSKDNRRQQSGSS